MLPRSSEWKVLLSSKLDLYHIGLTGQPIPEKLNLLLLSYEEKAERLALSEGKLAMLRSLEECYNYIPRKRVECYWTSGALSLKSVQQLTTSSLGSGMNRESVSSISRDESFDLSNWLSILASMFSRVGKLEPSIISWTLVSRKCFREAGDLGIIDFTAQVLLTTTQLLLLL